MRLIHARTYELHNVEERVPTTTIGSYAILSHTWGASEITFEQFFKIQAHGSDVSDGLDDASSGLWKIRKACQQAVSDGLNYVWVDTCRIDKTSSTELSEAINRMFSWYKNASVCYAYLEDVEADQISEDLAHTARMLLGSPEAYVLAGMGSIDINQMLRAKWFSRGWTLQELIAPTQVRFYDRAWRFVGTKESLKSSLEHVTGVDSFTLSGGNLELVSIARRMSWASRRVTTKMEDMAYCLLGIFGVNMTMQYGEGIKAFVRLQEEIMKDSSDQSLFAWQQSPPRNDVTSLQGIRPLEKGRSIFARHPMDFLASETIQGFPDHGEAYSLTNKGVHIEIPMLPMQLPHLPVHIRDTPPHLYPLHLAVLKCTFNGDRDALVAIVVQQVDHHARRFVRHDTAGLVQVSKDDCLEASLRKLYLCKNPPEFSPQSIIESRSYRRMTAINGSPKL